MPIVKFFNISGIFFFLFLQAKELKILTNKISSLDSILKSNPKRCEIHHDKLVRIPNRFSFHDFKWIHCVIILGVNIIFLLYILFVGLLPFVWLERNISTFHILSKIDVNYRYHSIFFFLSDVSCVEEKNVKKMPWEICDSRSELKIEQVEQIYLSWN